MYWNSHDDINKTKEWIDFELGNIETPVILTNTMSVAAALDALITYTLEQPGNENIASVNGIVGETNDSGLNDIRGRHIKPHHVLSAISNATSKALLKSLKSFFFASLNNDIL